MTAWAEEVRGRGERIAFVPTMGFLHRGHLQLMEEARRRAEKVAISIFVNPAQFGPQEDLARYPRDLEGDLAKAAAVGVDVAFVPDAGAMYPPGYQTYVQVTELERGLCGERRPGHFVGVATIVCKLFIVVRPHLALFGEKDFQQLAVIRRMAVDLNLSVEVVGCPTAREPDGLAMSSRNVYLSPDDRKRAAALHRGLAAAKARFAEGERSAEALVAAARAEIGPQVDRLEYIELRDADTLAPVSGTVKTRPAVMLLAAWVGGTRLIDNLRL